MTSRLEARQRAEQAARMSATGATWQEIADSLGYRSRQAVQQAVTRLTDTEPPESIEQARAKHDAALQLLQRNDFTRYLIALQGGDDETAIKYSKELRGIIAERAKMAGAYMPERQEVDVNVHQTPTAIIDRMRDELLALVAERPPRSAIGGGDIIEAEVIR